MFHPSTFHTQVRVFICEGSHVITCDKLFDSYTDESRSTVKNPKYALFKTNKLNVISIYDINEKQLLTSLGKYKVGELVTGSYSKGELTYYLSYEHCCYMARTDQIKKFGGHVNKYSITGELKEITEYEKDNKVISVKQYKENKLSLYDSFRNDVRTTVKFDDFQNIEFIKEWNNISGKHTFYNSEGNISYILNYDFNKDYSIVKNMVISGLDGTKYLEADTMITTDKNSASSFMDFYNSNNDLLQHKIQANYHGKVIRYIQNRLLDILYYKNGIRCLKCDLTDVKYYPNGKKSSSFDMLSGKYESYNDKGELMYSCYYKDKKLDGEYLIYNKENVSEKRMYKSDELVSTEYYKYNDANILIETKLIIGDEETVTNFRESKIAMITKSNKDSKIITYYTTEGKVSCVIEKMGNITLQKQYNESGYLLSEEKFEDSESNHSKIHYITYYENGNIEKFFKYFKRVYQLDYYDESRNILNTKIYVNGIEQILDLPDEKFTYNSKLDGTSLVVSCSLNGKVKYEYIFLQDTYCPKIRNEYNDQEKIFETTRYLCSNIIQKENFDETNALIKRTYYYKSIKTREQIFENSKMKIDMRFFHEIDNNKIREMTEFGETINKESVYYSNGKLHKTYEFILDTPYDHLNKHEYYYDGSKKLFCESVRSTCHHEYYKGKVEYYRDDKLFKVQQYNDDFKLIDQTDIVVM